MTMKKNSMSKMSTYPCNTEWHGLKRKEEYDYLLWFYQNADFGPADGDVRAIMNQNYETKTGKKVPEGFREEEED